MRFVSRSVVTGFVNALAILIFLAQMPELIGQSWQVWAMAAVGLGIIYLLPRLTGQIFFATAEAFHNAFDFREELNGVIIDVHAAHFWDITGINGLDRVVLKFRHHGRAVEIVGMNEASQTLVDRLAQHDKEGAALSAAH